MTDELRKKLTANIWKMALYYTFNKRGYASIIGVYLLTIPNTTAQSIGLMWLIGDITGLVLEVPSGYLSDKLGHKQALVLSRFFLALSTSAYLLGFNYWFFVLGMVISQAAGAFMSGTSTAFLHETMQALGREKDFTRVSGRIRSIGFLAPLPIYMGVPLLVTIDFRLGIAAVLLFDIISFIVATTLTKPPVSQAHIDEVSSRNFMSVVKEGYELGFIKYLVYGAFLAAMIWGMTAYRDVYQAAVEIPIAYFGFIFAFSRLLIGLTLWQNGRMKRWFTFNSFMLFKIVSAMAIATTLFLTREPWVIAMTFILATVLLWGFSEISKGFRMEIIGQSKFKATLISLGALMGNITKGVTIYLMGIAITKTSYPEAFGLLLTIGGPVLLLIWTYIFFASKKIAQSS